MSGHCRSASSLRATPQAGLLCAAKARCGPPFTAALACVCHGKSRHTAVAWPALRPLLSSNGRRCFGRRRSWPGCCRRLARRSSLGQLRPPYAGQRSGIPVRPLCCADRGADGSPTVTPRKAREFVCKPSLPRRHCHHAAPAVVGRKEPEVSLRSPEYAALLTLQAEPAAGTFLSGDPLVARYQESECTPAPPLCMANAFRCRRECAGSAAIGCALA